MVAFPVLYRLYASNGSTLVYTFPLVQSDNSPQDPKDFVEIAGLRGVGSIIIPGSTLAWDLTIRFILQGADYSALIAAMDTLETTIVQQTPYVLKIDRTQSTTKNYNVMRLSPFVFEDDGDFRNTFQTVQVTFRVNSWS
jgi:hypothetical protein